MHVAAQDIFPRLIEEELQIQGSRIGQCRHKAGQCALGSTHHHMTEVGLVDLGLFTGEHLEFQKRFTAEWPQAGNGSAQQRDAAVVAAIANHLIHAARRRGC
jgi:hypothetical protein